MLNKFFASGQDGALVRQPVFYRKNSDGEIKELDLSSPAGQERERDNTLEDYCPPVLIHGFLL